MTQDLKRQLFLQLLLESYAPQQAPKIWKKLPIANEDIPKVNTNINVIEPLNANLFFLKKIHYTWLAHYISHLPPNYQQPVASVFPDFSKIMKRLNRPSAKCEKKGDVDPYLFHLLIEKIGLKDRLPTCFLPAGSFDALISWDRQKILSLIDILPLADASKEIKQIVDRNKLLLIDAALTNEQKIYLKKCMVVKHATCDLTIHLKNWQGTKEGLKIHLHKLGLELFYKGLYQENTDFLFYLSHLLDIGRGIHLLNGAQMAKNEEKKDLYYKNFNQCYKFISSYEKSER